MNCECQNKTIYSNDLQVIIPSGCLGNTKIVLQCKSPAEAVYYSFSLQNRLPNNEIITAVEAEPSGDTGIKIDDISFINHLFKCRISGGNLNTFSGIRFIVTTNTNSIREFDITLPILPAGTMSDGVTDNNYVIGDRGKTGATGEAGTIAIGKVITGDVGTNASVTNTGTDTNAVFDFTIPRGEAGTGLPEGSLIHDGMIISPDQIGVLPSDLILNGNLYTAPGAYLDGTKQLPSGLFLNSNIVMTDGSVFFPHTINNNGVLCAA